MRLSLMKMSHEALTPMKDIAGRIKGIGNQALRKKYNYSLRQFTPLDGVHGYAYWVMKYKFSEMWPLMSCFAIYAGFASYLIWWTFQKHEIMLNRFAKHKPWDWERSQYRFDKRHKAFFNDSFMWKRIPELDKLQAEMLEEKNKRLAAAKAQKGHH